MRVLSRPRLRAFARMHPDAEVSLSSWWAMMRRKTYRAPHDLKRDFASVDFVGSRVAVFNICGNRYRLVAHVRYDVGLVYVRHILTHDEYDNLVL